ncbi:MAG: NB-ARC domain-containing protein, partial [Cyanobacteriota bacterium]|nr:NB-ARC domain-containing protein [Cyanobacteriota bacterium]
MMMRRTKARRGVILTSEGWQKLQNAQQEREKQENSVKSYTIEILSEITKLDPATISKVLHREVGVDKRTLERFFHAFNLEFSQSDYKKLDLVPNKVEKVLDDKRNHYFGKEAPDVSTFYGRTEEINLLKQWILDDNCRLIALVGIGGIGKTTLSAKVAENLSQYFDYSIWFSLRNAPLPITIITNLVQIFSNGEETDLGQNTTIIINRLIGYLQNQRCLVILDNIDAIFSEGCYSGHYLGGYEGYGELFQKLGESLHQSCLLMTSRDKPKEVAAMEGQELPIRSLQITGLDIPEVKEIFKVKGIFEAKDSDLKQLINHYSGNPLYLKVIATTVLDLFEGNLADFLAQNKILFGDISDLLDRQFKRLSKLEKTLLYWLAINREPVNINELKADLLLPKLEYTNKSIQEFTISHQFNLLEILESLHRRSLIEKTRDSDNCQKFFLQPVILEYVTINLIHTILHEIICQEISLCQSHALLKATAPDYIQDIQQRLILAPIIDHLERTLGSQEAIEEKLMNILDEFRGKSENFTGYIAGNVINLLSSFSTKISNKDLSRLNILQGKLQGITLKNINFKNSNFTKTTFTDTFGIIFSLAFSENEEFLVTGSIRGEVCVWRWKDNQQIFKRQEHTTIVDSVTFSPDSNKIASSSRDRTVKIWDTITGKCIFTFKSPNHHAIKNLAFNADGSQLFGYSSQEIISWDLETGHSTILITSEHRICSLRLSSRSSILVLGCENGQVDVWDIHKKALINRFQMNNGLILSVKITDEEQILACSLDKELDNKVVKIWDLQNQQCLDKLKSQSYHISLI